VGRRFRFVFSLDAWRWRSLRIFGALYVSSYFQFTLAFALPRRFAAQVFLVFAGARLGRRLSTRSYLYARPAGCKLTSTNKTPTQMASSLTFDLNVPEAEEGNAWLDLNEPVLEEDNDIGKFAFFFASLLSCFLAFPLSLFFFLFI
jgi:hypothetical protein